MATLNEVKYAALLNSTGAEGTIDELETLWLKNRGRTGTLNEMWYQEFAAAGFTGAWNSAAAAWLRAFGYFGTLNERWYQFWTDGGSINPNLIVNGDFATDTDWAKGLGWTISGGEACCSGVQLSSSDLAQSTTLVPATTYRLRYTIRNYVAGTIQPVVGGVNGTVTAGNGLNIVQDFTAIATGSMILKANVDFIGCVDDVSLREI